MTQTGSSAGQAMGEGARTESGAHAFAALQWPGTVSGSVEATI